MKNDIHDKNSPLLEADKRNQLSGIRTFPFVCAVVFIVKILLGRVRFSKGIGTRKFILNDDTEYSVFRKMNVVSKQYIENSNTFTLIVRFKFVRFSQNVNRLLSIIPIPLIAGYPGFIEKIWMVNVDTSEWLGLYEWQTEQHAKRYIDSIALRMMMKRAIGKNAIKQIIPKSKLSNYLKGVTN